MENEIEALNKRLSILENNHQILQITSGKRNLLAELDIINKQLSPFKGWLIFISIFLSIIAIGLVFTSAKKDHSHNITNHEDLHSKSFAKINHHHSYSEKEHSHNDFAKVKHLHEESYAQKKHIHDELSSTNHVHPFREHEHPFKEHKHSFQEHEHSYAKEVHSHEEFAKLVIPVGTIVPFYGNVDQIPTGWLLCNGEPLSIDVKPLLVEHLMNANPKLIVSVKGRNNAVDTIAKLPDLRGLFLRGSSGERGIGYLEEDSTRIPSALRIRNNGRHDHRIRDNGRHNHNIGLGGRGNHVVTQGSHSHRAETKAAHSHTVHDVVAHIHEGLHIPTSGGVSYAPDGLGGALFGIISSTRGRTSNYSVSAGGNHTHPLGPDGEHTHIIHGGNESEHFHNVNDHDEHAHSISTEDVHFHEMAIEEHHSHEISGSDSETRPKNVAVNFIIKY